MVELPPRNRLNVCPLPAKTDFKELLGIPVLEAQNHPKQQFKVARYM
jgi:hypothetical protein